MTAQEQGVCPSFQGKRGGNNYLSWLPFRKIKTDMTTSIDCSAVSEKSNKLKF